MPVVFNKRVHGHPAGSVYIGRPTRWGNPFVIGPDGDRAAVIAKFREWVMLPAQAALRDEARRILKGRDLVCFCTPSACHGDVWLEIANAEES